MFVPEYSFLIPDCVSNQYPVLSIISFFFLMTCKMKNQNLQSMYSQVTFHCFVLNNTTGEKPKQSKGQFVTLILHLCDDQMGREV